MTNLKKYTSKRHPCLSRIHQDSINLFKNLNNNLSKKVLQDSTNPFNWALLGGNLFVGVPLAYIVSTGFAIKKRLTIKLNSKLN